MVRSLAFRLSQSQHRLELGLSRVFSRTGTTQRLPSYYSQHQIEKLVTCQRCYYSSLEDPAIKSRLGFSSSSDDKQRKSRKVIIGRTPRSKASKKRNQQKSGKATGSDQIINHIIGGGTPCDPAPPPFELANFGEDSLYTLVLLRHGESEWNRLNQYTGWYDVALTKKGETEARDAGRLLYENGIEIDHAFTSVLKRASFSCNMALNTARQHWVPVTKSWRLNERHYGALQGYNKDTAFKELGLDQELVMQMRRSYDVPPPVMKNDHPYWHGNDRRCELYFVVVFHLLSHAL